jgi:uncharacterized protein
VAGEQLQQLIQLQEKDRKIVQIQRELRQVPDKRKALETRRASAVKDFETAQATLRACQLQMKELDLDIEGMKGQIRRYKTQQLEVRDNESYRALEGEINDVQKRATFKEDQELSLMEQAETIKKGLVDKEAFLNKIKADIQVELDALTDRETKLNEDLAKWTAERQEFLPGVDATWLGRYEQILRNKGDFALVGVDAGGICGGCHMKVSPATVMSAKNLNQITTCSYCGRMLYFRIA